MTSKVIVDAHAGWPIKVTAIDTYPQDAEPKHMELGIVQPGEVREFHCTNTRQIMVSEMPRVSAETVA